MLEAHQADICGPLVVREPQVENRCKMWMAPFSFRSLYNYIFLLISQKLFLLTRPGSASEWFIQLEAPQKYLNTIQQQHH